MSAHALPQKSSKAAVRVKSDFLIQSFPANLQACLHHSDNGVCALIFVIFGGTPSTEHICEPHFRVRVVWALFIGPLRIFKFVFHVYLIHGFGSGFAVMERLWTTYDFH